ncbi:uncharacterized protein N7487_008752 [Penicillium crustosum]|uniref:uncharacterized protein n=1 Tax=Penicillium crustosum TaxID=36656 RepID=UPI00238D1973|nr:uncharacterized protein N7487_008752 [Penicillium crustosum]KAJ5402856.1 hypothetical protein N7487_008752 [Penicillium crustosum]
MGTWNRRFNFGGLRLSASDQISITIVYHLYIQRRAREGTKRWSKLEEKENIVNSYNPGGKLGGLIIIHPSGPRLPPTEHSKKKPTCGPNFSLLSGFDPFYNIPKIAIHTNRII